MKKILAALDLGPGHEAVLERTLELAQGTGGKVWLLHVAAPNPDFVGYEAGPQVVRDSVAQHYRDEHRHVQAAADKLRAAGVDVTALLVQGSTADTILSEAARLDANVIVVGSHGRGALYRAMLGSVSAAVLTKTRLPVLVVPTRGA